MPLLPGLPLAVDRIRGVALEVILEVFPFLQLVQYLNLRFPIASLFAFDLATLGFTNRAQTRFYIPGIRNLFTGVLAIGIKVVVYVFLLLSTVTFITMNVGVAFHPVCEANWISTSQFCRIVHSARQMTSASLFYPPFFKASSDVLADVVEESILVTTSSIDLTKAHIAVDDLILLVKHSKLSRKETLLSSLEELHVEARSTGLRLQSFSTSLDAAIDLIVVAHQHVVNGVDDFDPGLLSVAQDYVCVAFLSFASRPICPSSSTLELGRRYRHALSTFEEELKALILLAFNLMRLLDGLDTRLRTILYVAKEEEVDAIKAREVVRNRFLTNFGFNKKQLVGYDQAINIVLEVRKYIAVARDVVADAHSKLFELQEELIQARRTAAEGSNVDWLPLHESARLLKSGVERLQAAQRRTRIESGNFAN